MQTAGRGEMLVSLCYTPAVNRLTVVVLKARNLPKMDVTGMAGAYKHDVTRTLIKVRV